MKFFLHIALLSLIGFTCNTRKLSKNKAALFSENKNEKKTPNKVIDTTVEENIERKKFYGFDTLLIKEYKSENEHLIRLEGSKSKNVYRITVKSKQGNSKKFQIAENWYIASHSLILWDSEDYIFVRSNCGTGCWEGKLLSLNDEKPIKNYMHYVYDDSVRNFVVYPDSSDLFNLTSRDSITMIFENFKSEKKITRDFNLCQETLIVMSMIRSVYFEDNNLITVEYLSEDCQTLKKKQVNIEK